MLFRSIYVWALLSMKGRSAPASRQTPAVTRMEPVATPSFAVAGPPAEDPFDFEDEPVHVVVREASVGV